MCVFFCVQNMAEHLRLLDDPSTEERRRSELKYRVQDDKAELQRLKAKLASVEASLGAARAEQGEHDNTPPWRPCCLGYRVSISMSGCSGDLCACPSKHYFIIPHRRVEKNY